MSLLKFQGKYRIQSIRHPDHEYNRGMYFITICTKDKLHYFGEIFGGEINLSQIGIIAKEIIEKTNLHFPNTEIPVFAIMPNHIHMIVCIDEVENTIDSRDAIYGVSTEITDSMEIFKNKKMQSIALKGGRLSHVVGKLKAAITRSANQNNIPFAWQTRFHDRIIRNQDECNRIVDYIEKNPFNWISDEYNNL